MTLLGDKIERLIKDAGDAPVRIGLMGGTFDPVHDGHMHCAMAAMSACRLDGVSFIPTGDPWMKERAITAVEHRLSMTRLACAGYDFFDVGPIEAERTGKTYTVDTLEQLSRSFHCNVSFYFIGGDDLVSSFHHWVRPDRICQLSNIVIVRRSEDPGLDFSKWIEKGLPLPLVVEAPLVPRSSTEIRRSLADGEDPAGVSDAVLSYIRSHGLYTPVREG